jgi:hypothetical protein
MWSRRVCSMDIGLLQRNLSRGHAKPAGKAHVGVVRPTTFNSSASARGVPALHSLSLHRPQIFSPARIASRSDTCGEFVSDAGCAYVNAYTRPLRTSDGTP